MAHKTPQQRAKQKRIRRTKKARRRQGEQKMALSQPAASHSKPKPSKMPSRLSEFYKSLEWKRLSYEIRRDRGQRCECCGATPEHGVRIVCDHIKPIRHHWHLRLDVNNVQVLCDSCNRGKGHWDETDWRAESRVRQLEDEFASIEREAQGFVH